ncbi:hypothetical protein AQUCO_05800106v1 [Aquilegia coerulea]|uniref:WW domain-containing protein n=1 Tax=Aquilegia coerulea TaxID=218851 RepID=A0A2G5CEU6_AQUCA|nr:hypothetical protein AQUCO_05800106v1 [Aquilegia coerulea]
MMKDLLQPAKQDVFLRQEVHDKEKVKKSLQQFGELIDHAELSLGPSRRGLLLTETRNTSSSESETKTPKKRKYKYFWDSHSNIEPMIQTSVELQLKESLPLDWEQCLDLESGRMYYLNRKTLKKSSTWPKDHKLDLELNISTPSSSVDEEKNSFEMSLMNSKKHVSSSSNMVAVACMKCHLLVMLCRSSPSCPNCKYVHSLLPAHPQPQGLLSQNTAKPLHTLSLLH